jgi:hypothetical protein
MLPRVEGEKKYRRVFLQINDGTGLDKVLAARNLWVEDP